MLLFGNRTGAELFVYRWAAPVRGWKYPIEQKDHKMLDPVCCQQPMLKAPLEAVAGIQL